MNLFVVLLGLVCALAYGAPYVEDVDYPQAAYVLDSVPSDDTRVVNGEAAVRDQFPYQLSLRWANVSRSPSHLCGGTLVTPSMVLTAAHCMLYNYGTYDVVAGVLNRTENTSSTQRRDIETRILHENWPGGNRVARYDIALLKLSAPFILTRSVQLIRLPCQNDIPSGTAVLSGWGYTSSLANTLPMILQYVEVDIISNEQCADDLNTVLGTILALDDTMVCTNGHQNISSCGGDSGGPLVQDGVQVGIDSWGIVPCGVTVGPSVFTRVSNYTDWIISKLSSDDVKYLCLVCALAYGAPYVEYKDYPQAAYVLDSLPSDDTRIVNGEGAVRDQFPYQLSLRWANVSASPSHLCGSTLVTPSVVLTAAHCMLFDYGTYDVVAGLLDRTENTSSTQRRDIETRILHENWPGGNRISRYDIALLKLTSPFILTPSVQLIRLPCQNAIPSGTVVISGWGYTSSLDDELPVMLQYVEVDIISNQQCADDLIAVLGDTRALDDTMICTNGHQNISSCGGDSGGPLVQNGIQLGIVSWGIVPCGAGIGPTVYTRVSNYTDWIKSKL
ncbi:transmembrane protease serine 9-like [Agrilus planipennis]|uniref:Transmembrane protease serine 9-like n=1 Tax=Agrilus planipennis TaxID=224129 RepID=A0A1W4WIX2_AGRPL|nr:transmembrane protease serine 9-like [Agrilus planipennis]